MNSPTKYRRPSRRTVVVTATATAVILGGAAAAIILSDSHAGTPGRRPVAAAVKTVPAPATTQTPVTPSPAVQPTVPAAEPFDKSRYSTTDAASLWVVVNKKHPLTPIDYVPADLTTAYGKTVSARLVPDLTAMITDAAKAGANLTLASAYRSYAYQTGLYNTYVAQDGQAEADTYSARPGYSEHQTGLAIDFGDRAGTCIIEPCFSGTAEGAWLAANAYKYGFLLRYTAAKQSVTGYEAEAWHYRYIGRDLATEMHADGIVTLEEFFGIEGGGYN